MTAAATLVPEKGGDRQRISRRRKAAIIVRLLVAQGADLPLGALPGHLQAALTAELGAMRYIDADTLREVVAEFLRELESIGLTFPSGVEGALKLLDGHISPDAAAEVQGAGKPTDPWVRIAEMAPEQLLPILAAESAEVAAVVLSKLATERAAEILSLLPGEQARRIACAVSLTGRVAPHVVAEIGQTIMEQLDAAPESAFAVPPADRIGEILNVAPSATREAVLAGLDEEDSGFAESVRKSIFTFEDIPARLRERDVPSATRVVPGDVLVTALAGAKGTSEPVAEFILSNMSRRMADQLREEMAERGEVREKDAEAAKTQVVAAIRKLEAAGEISLRSEEEEES